MGLIFLTHLPSQIQTRIFLLSTSFVAQFTNRGGPPPASELNEIIDRFRAHPDQTWFPTSLGKGWKPSEDSRFLVFCRTQEGVYAISGKVLSKSDTIPDIGFVHNLYVGHVFGSWWNVSDLRLHRWASLESIPGVQIKSRKRASASFAGTATFAYWDFSGVDFDNVE